MYAEAFRGLEADLVLVGSYAHDELESTLAPLLACGAGPAVRGRGPRGASPSDDGTRVTAFKEFPGAVLAKMSVKLPALLGILSADEPPRYVPVSRIRAAMKTAKIEEQEVEAAAAASPVAIERLYHPAAGERAEILAGSAEDVAAKIVNILKEKGVGQMSSQDVLVVAETNRGQVGRHLAEMLGARPDRRRHGRQGPGRAAGGRRGRNGRGPVGRRSDRAGQRSALGRIIRRNPTWPCWKAW